MKKILSYLFTKWWPLLAISVVSIVLFYELDNLWLLLFGSLTILTSIIILFQNKRWMLGSFSILILLMYWALAIFWVYIMVFPTPYGIHRMFSKEYENRSKIENIIGVEIPRFKIVESELVHLGEFDFEFEIRSELEFKSDFDDHFFHELDSICALHAPEKPDENSSFFYYGLEQIGKCWSKSGGRYYYSRNTDFGEKFLHSKDAYFEFSITKGSRTAKMSYGNY